MRCETHQLDLGDGCCIDWEPSDCPYCHIQELEQRLKDKDQQLLEENLQVKRLEQQLEECKLDLRMAITKEQDLVDAEIEIVNLKAQNAKLVEALVEIEVSGYGMLGNKKCEACQANIDIAAAALKEVKGE